MMANPESLEAESAVVGLVVPRQGKPVVRGNYRSGLEEAMLRGREKGKRKPRG
jgi:hypothetical protein